MNNLFILNDVKRLCRSVGLICQVETKAMRNLNKIQK